VATSRLEDQAPRALKNEYIPKVKIKRMKSDMKNWLGVLCSPVIKYTTRSKIVT